MKIKFGKGIGRESLVCWIIMTIASIACLAPVIMVISTSFSSNKYVTLNGYTFFPKEFTLDTYIYLMGNQTKTLVRAFSVSIISTIGGTVFGLILTVTYAYAVAQSKEYFRFGNALSFIAWFTTIFSGGVLPWYIVCTQWLGLRNNIFAWIVPGAFGAMNMFILKNNFKSIPKEMTESAQIDGASDARIFWSICLPLVKSGIVTVAMFLLIGYWNNFSNGKYLITQTRLYNLQQLLNSLMGNAMALLSNPSTEGVLAHIEIPSNTIRSAVTCLAIAPIMILYPFTLRFFIKGINVGAVKG